MNLNLDSYDQEYLVNIIKSKVKEKLGDIPKRGVFAGQAVASAIYEAFGLTENAPYKDIDVFGQESDFPSFELEMVERSKNNGRGIFKVTPNEGMHVYKTSHDINIGSIKQIGYEIRSSFMGYENQNVNFVEVGYYLDGVFKNNPTERKKENAKSIIESFDLNCVQIALDLSTNQLVWTRAFQDFLFSKDIKPVYFGTPMHTSIRLLKKEKDIDFATLNMDAEMLKLQTARQIGVEVERMKRESGEDGRDFLPGSLFSDVYKKRFNSNRDVLEKYFRMQDKIIKVEEDKERKFAVLNPMSYNSKVVDLFMNTMIIPETKMNEGGIRIPPYIDDKIAEFERFYTLCTVDSKKNRQIINNLNEIIKDVEPKKYSMGLSLVVSHLLKTDRKDFSGLQAEHLKRLIKVTDNHPRAIAELMEQPISIRELAQIAKNINWLDKNNLRHYIGFIENGLFREEKPGEGPIYNSDPKKDDFLNRFTSIREIMHNYRNFNMGSAYREDTLRLSELLDDDFKNDIKEKNKSLMSKGMNISVNPMANDIIDGINVDLNIPFSIREITNWSNLIIEGGEMKHCVGGYWEAINSHRSSIFHIDTEIDGKIEPSTIEISLKDDGKDKSFAIVQHQGPYNRQIPMENEVVGQALVGVLNRELKRNLDKTISDFPDKSKLTNFEEFYLGSITNTSREEVRKGFFNDEYQKENKIQYEYYC